MVELRPATCRSHQLMRIPKPGIDGRYTWLLAGLLLLLIVGPLVGRFEIIGGGLYIGDFILVMVLLVAVRAFFREHHHFLICLSLAILAVIGGSIARALSADAAVASRVVGHAAEAGLLGYMTLLIGRDIFTTDDVDTDTICGAVSVYLLIAATFAVVFTILETLDPTAFRLPSDIRIPDASLGPDRLMAYFSIVTITTVGYGDITPKAEMARSLANLEALLGQVYLTVLVARLVGRNLTQSFEKKRSQE